MVDIQCEKCETVLNDNFRFTLCSYPKTGKPGDLITINLSVKCLNKYFAGDARLCLYDGLSLIGTSMQVTMQPGSTKKFAFGFIMPDTDILYNVSLLGQNIFAYDCEDYKEVSIEKSTITGPSVPDEPKEEVYNNLLLYAAIIVLLMLYVKRKM